MFATHYIQHVNHWFSPLSRWSQTTAESVTPAQAMPSEQIIVQPGDVYFLAAGTYHVRVLTGQRWLPEHGILTAGAQVALRVEDDGVEARPATAHPVVFTLCPHK